MANNDLANNIGQPGESIMSTARNRLLSDYPVSLQHAAYAIYGDRIRQEAESRPSESVAPEAAARRQSDHRRTDGCQRKLISSSRND